MAKFLVDADALVALAKEDDSNHKKALKIAQVSSGVSLYATPFTIPEATTVLSYKVSQKTAKQFLGQARQRKLIELKLTAQITQLADEVFLQQNLKGTSWIDCLNVATIKHYSLDGIFSFDKFYKKFRIKYL